MLRHMHPKRGCDCRRSSKHEGTGSPRPIARRSRRAGGYSPVLRLTADEVSLPLFPCPQKFTFWDTTLLPRGTFFGQVRRSARGRPKAVFLLLACCTQEEDAGWCGTRSPSSTWKAWKQNFLPSYSRSGDFSHCFLH